MDNGQFGHAPQELLALQDTPRLHANARLRPPFDSHRYARGQGRTCAYAQWQEGKDKAQRLREVDNSVGSERKGARQHCQEVSQGAHQVARPYRHIVSARRFQATIQAVDNRQNAEVEVN